MKLYSILLVIREMHIKITGEYQYTLTRMAKINRTKNTQNCCERSGRSLIQLMNEQILVHSQNGVPCSNKMKKLWLHATTWMNHKNIFLTERNQTKE